MAKKPWFHYMDLFWSRFPFPNHPVVHIVKTGPLWSIEAFRLYLTKKLTPVKVYIVGDTLVDTGPSFMGRTLVRLVKNWGVKKAVVTHHHEDHSGNMGILSQNGIEIYSSEKTKKILEPGFPIPFYRHLAWGKASASSSHVLGDSVDLGPYKAQVLPAPGHAEDQVVFYVPQEGWLFSADAFIHPRIKYFMRGEDFHTSKETLKRLIQLDFEILFCQHNPRIRKGKEALKKKLAWFEEMEERAKELRQQGLSIQEISRKILGPSYFMPWLTAGEVSSENMIASILKK